MMAKEDGHPPFRRAAPTHRGFSRRSLPGAGSFRAWVFWHLRLVCAVLVTAWLAPRAALATNLVMLFDKKCPRCAQCAYYTASKRKPGAATLTLFARQNDSFFAIERWSATYGSREGSKQCWRDFRTPEGLYYTQYVNERHREHPQYGFVSVVLDYPNLEDRTEPNRSACGEDCVHLGAAIAIHGGFSGPTNGCIRLLDSDMRSKIHYRSALRLADLVRTAPQERLPVISVPVAAAGCQPEIGQPVSNGCAAILRQLLDASERPLRAVVTRGLASAADYTAAERAQLVRAAPVAVAPTRPEADQLSPVSAQLLARQGRLAPVPIAAAWATSEAPVCGPSRDQPCRASSLIDGNPNTAWCENVDGVGEGESVLLELKEPRKVARVDLRNGSWQGGRFSVDWVRNGRVTELDVVTDGFPELCRRLEADPSEWSCASSSSSGPTKYIRLRIHRAVRGELSDHTCISDVTVLAEPEGESP